MSQSPVKVIYFTAGQVPSAREVAEILRLQLNFSTVLVRRGDIAADATYGSGRKEYAAEIALGTVVLAGTNIPTAYSGLSGAVTLTVSSVIAPDQFVLLPATRTIDASDVDVQQMVAAKAVVDPSTGLARIIDLSGNPMVTYASSDAAKATVSSTGLVTAVAAGSAVITATLQPGTSVTGGTLTATTDIYAKTAHGFGTGAKVNLVSLTGGTGAVAGTDYYFRRIDADSGYLCATLANALAGTPVVDITVDATSVVLAYSDGLQVTGGTATAATDLYAKTAHGFDTGDAVKLVSLTNGTGLTAGTTYYFRKTSADAGYLCSSLANAVAEPVVPVNVTVDGTAVVLQRAPITATATITVQA